MILNVKWFSEYGGWRGWTLSALHFLSILFTLTLRLSVEARAANKVIWKDPPDPVMPHLSNYGPPLSLGPVQMTHLPRYLAYRLWAVMGKL